jgi:hypothetical protein
VTPEPPPEVIAAILKEQEEQIALERALYERIVDMQQGAAAATEIVQGLIERLAEDRDAEAEEGEDEDEDEDETELESILRVLSDVGHSLSAVAEYLFADLPGGDEAA